MRVEAAVQMIGHGNSIEGHKGCDALDAGVGEFIIEWLFNLLLPPWVVCVAFLLR